MSHYIWKDYQKHCDLCEEYCPICDDTFVFKLDSNFDMNLLAKCPTCGTVQHLCSACPMKEDCDWNMARGCSMEGIVIPKQAFTWDQIYEGAMDKGFGDPELKAKDMARYELGGIIEDVDGIDIENHEEVESAEEYIDHFLQRWNFVPYFNENGEYFGRMRKDLNAKAIENGMKRVTVNKKLPIINGVLIPESDVNDELLTYETLVKVLGAIEVNEINLNAMSARSFNKFTDDCKMFCGSRWNDGGKKKDHEGGHMYFLSKESAEFLKEHTPVETIYYHPELMLYVWALDVKLPLWNVNSYLRLKVVEE